MLVAVMLCVQCLVKLTQIRFLNAYFLVIYHDTQCLIVNNTSVFMLSRFGIWFFQVVLRVPDLGWVLPLFSSPACDVAGEEGIGKT